MAVCQLGSGFSRLLRHETVSKQLSRVNRDTMWGNGCWRSQLSKLVALCFHRIGFKAIRSVSFYSAPPFTFLHLHMFKWNYRFALVKKGVQSLYQLPILVTLVLEFSKASQLKLFAATNSIGCSKVIVMASW